MTTTSVIHSPVGPLLVITSENGVQHIRFVDEAPASTASTSPDAVLRELAAYFAGDLQRFTVPIDWTGVSGFTRQVLTATAEIPYGATVSYGAIAKRIGMPGATQAVGNALGANPVPIVVPCHRVIRSDGSMGWFSGGPDIKRALLRLEGLDFPEQATLPF